ncbi:hypothetical protein [Aneurinibacillus migulanus]|uniref:Uncharacterized protein n=1 Tax=Aneurinibacillus migulanus TaxID=47500 RepID=A0A1G9C2C9_ANEMI|nr:hypothetical protein [Aneurinibacillus migulanus]MED0895675.1 hypothetical protein [Aneurinibacillus migulanus]MED1619848.1 hypothetical protein [Aneurinibacillus migulanus]GED17466.1 hypothetical protein AMI01nite_54570 [Aneurinibacillus migulanus]SDK45849.1 hypothetical protein SAMN04487909_1572 [Aneurinibacillus migulanus]
MEVQQRIEIALDIKGMSGEGAWHEAYLFSTKEYNSLVIRFPKQISYGKPFSYFD